MILQSFAATGNEFCRELEKVQTSSENFFDKFKPKTVSIRVKNTENGRTIET